MQYTRNDEILGAMVAWEREHGRRVTTVYVSTALSHALASEACVVFDATKAVAAMARSRAGADWVEDPTLPPDGYRFE